MIRSLFERLSFLVASVYWEAVDALNEWKRPKRRPVPCDCCDDEPETVEELVGGKWREP